MSSTDIVLAPGERGLYSQTVRPNFLLFWLKTNLLVTNKRIAVKGPNTLLGIIPLGFEEKSMPIGSVAGVTNSLKVYAGRLIIFGILALVGLSLLFQEDDGGAKFGGFLMFLIFGVLAMNAICPRLQVTNNGGGVNDTEVSFLDSSRMEQFKTKANEIIYSASAGGQSWSDAYAAGTDEFQNRHQHGPQGQAPQSGYGYPQAQQGNYPQAQQQASYQQQPQQGFGFGQPSASEQQSQQQWSQESRQSQPEEYRPATPAEPRPGQARTTYGEPTPSWARQPESSQQEPGQQPGRHSAPRDGNGTPDNRWTSN